MKIDLNFIRFLLSFRCFIHSFQTVYGGARSAMLDYFEGIGYKCEAHNNPTDHVLDVIVKDQVNSDHASFSLIKYILSCIRYLVLFLLLSRRVREGSCKKKLVMVSSTGTCIFQVMFFDHVPRGRWYHINCMRNTQNNPGKKYRISSLFYFSIDFDFSLISFSSIHQIRRANVEDVEETCTTDLIQHFRNSDIFTEECRMVEELVEAVCSKYGEFFIF